MPARRLCFGLAVAFSLSSLGLAAVAPPEAEDREIPPDRGRQRLQEKDQRELLRHLLDLTTPLEKRVEIVAVFAVTRDERALPALLKLATDAKQPIALRVATLWTLGEIGDPRGMPALQNALYKIYLRDPAWRYDKGIPVEGEKEPVSLQQMCEDQLARLAEASVGGAAGKPVKSVVAVLAELLESRTKGEVSEIPPSFKEETPEADRLRAALITLAAVGDRDPRAVKALCNVLRADDRCYPWDFKIIAAERLGDLVARRCKQFEAVKARDKIVESIGEAFIEGAAIVTDIPEVRQIAGTTLRRMGWADKAGERLAYFLQNPGIPKEVRYRTIEALTFIRSKAATDALIFQLYDRDNNVRWRAAIALGATGDPKALPFLHKCTRDPDPMVRGRTIAALGHLEDQSALPDLIAALMDPVPSVRRQAALALGRVGGPAAIPPLVRALKDPSPPVRENAIVALGYIRRASGLRAVAKMVADSEPLVRLAAVQVLERFRNPGATQALIAALGDADATVRDAATRAIRDRLAGHPKETVPVLSEAIANGQGPARLAALKCLADDYRAAKIQKEGSARLEVYQSLLGGADGALCAALVACLTDSVGETRGVAGQLLAEYAWGRKDKALLERVAALAADTDTKARNAGVSARSYLGNLR